jgi:hypothetical protein
MKLDLQSLVYLLNCNNKNMYWDVMIYIKQKDIYKDIVGHDLGRFERFKQCNMILCIMANKKN